ncbi:MAG: hypothetical protein ACOYL6_15520 [Bacteriovoracaceae bacterium]
MLKFILGFMMLFPSIVMAEQPDLLDQALEGKLKNCTVNLGGPETACDYYVNVGGQGYPIGTGCTQEIYMGTYGCFGSEREVANCLLKRAQDAGICGQPAKNIVELGLQGKLGKCSVVYSASGNACTYYVNLSGKGYPIGTGCAQERYMKTYGCTSSDEKEVAACLLTKAMNEKLCF